MKKPEGLDKLKAALRKIAGVPKVEVERRLDEERQARRGKKMGGGRR